MSSIRFFQYIFITKSEPYLGPLSDHSGYLNQIKILGTFHVLQNSDIFIYLKCAVRRNDLINRVFKIWEEISSRVLRDLIPRPTRTISTMYSINDTLLLRYFYQQQTFRQWWTFTYINGIYVTLVVWNGD